MKYIQATTTQINRLQVGLIGDFGICFWVNALVNRPICPFAVLICAKSLRGWHDPYLPIEEEEEEEEEEENDDEEWR